MDYVRLIEFWAGVFGAERMVVRSYEEACKNKGGIVGDFFDVLDFQLQGDTSTNCRQNQSIDAVSLEILRMLNKEIGPSYTAGKPNKFRDSLRLAFESLSEGMPFFPDQESRQNFMRKFYSDNRVINERWFSGRSGLPASDKELKRKSACLCAEPSNEEIYKRFGKAWMYSREQRCPPPSHRYAINNGRSCVS